MRSRENSDVWGANVAINYQAEDVKAIGGRRHEDCRPLPLPNTRNQQGEERQSAGKEKKNTLMGAKQRRKEWRKGQKHVSAEERKSPGTEENRGTTNYETDHRFSGNEIGNSKAGFKTGERSHNAQSKACRNKKKDKMQKTRYY